MLKLVLFIYIMIFDELNFFAVLEEIVDLSAGFVAIENRHIEVHYYKCVSEF